MDRDVRPRATRYNRDRKLGADFFGTARGFEDQRFLKSNCPEHRADMSPLGFLGIFDEQRTVGSAQCPRLPNGEGSFV